MKILVFCALIFGLESVFAQTVTIQPYYTSPEHNSVIFVVKKNLALSCNVTVDGDIPEGQALRVDWKKDNRLVGDIDGLKNRIKLTNVANNYSLTVSDGVSEDVGNWSCHAMIGEQEKAFSEIHVATTIDVKIKTEYINVVEEEKLRIECSILGNPQPSIVWKIETGNYNSSSDLNDERIKIENYSEDNGRFVENGVLIITKINKEDRGDYFCIGTNQYWDQNRAESKAMVRVKDKYAALWPFLGICAEVVVLCAVIIIYEKKRNTTELEESDTDQSPDQKNTPDHGKEANLRHRQ